MSKCPECGEEIRAIGKWVSHRERGGSTRRILKRTSDYDKHDEVVKWPIQRKAALHRAGDVCEICDVSGDLDVHHLIKRRYFEEEERSHALENLVVLCRSCHADEENKNNRKTLMEVLRQKENNE